MNDSAAEQKNNPRILLVEDDPDIAKLVMLHLADIDASVAYCERGDDGLQRASSEEWDLLILDLRLPGMNGLDICRKLRQEGDHTPLLMLTSKSSELDRVLGLELGADDYVTKPFSPIELLARVKALLRRASLPLAATPETAVESIDCGALSICPRDHRVTVSDREIELTSKEFDLLLHFAQHPGQVFRRAELLDSVWGYGHEGYEHTVNSHINRLRSKIEDTPAQPNYIVTVWGVGYKFSEAQAAL